ncbi:DEAD/DEAH box helicase [Turicibacter sanguinis]|uniref:DEAD/DEAH box helicase n=1 Tax=Turicibacter sanguinis TaxID=154288 RepID=UPI0021D4F3C1|nr:DEAD/DEAH box helicase [Turicibacter sanguinis]MCU7195446.1 helicase [Turicibacter sanguinis]
MQDLCGREWTAQEYEMISNDRRLDKEELEVIKGLEKRDGHWFCSRCLNEKSFGQYVYRGERLTYCRECLDFKQINQHSLLYRSKRKATITHNAHVLNADFQLSTLQQEGSNFSQEILNKGYIGMNWAVCGAGKTEMMFESISCALKEGKRVCWAIPRADVVVELVPRLRQAFPNALVVGLHGGSDEKDKYGDIVITTTHQLIRFYQAFEFLIIDEVDAFPYTFDAMLPRLANKACVPGCATIYLSATPSKQDQRRIKKGDLKCCLIPARYHLYPLDIPKFKWCGHFEQKIARQRLPLSVKKWMLQKIEMKRRALLFVPTIEAGHQLARALKKRLKIEVEFVYSGDSNRLDKVRRFKEGDGQFLITTMILERGVTIADIDVAILGAEHEVFEESALVQISGRVGRSPKFPHGEIVFFHYGVTQAMDDAREQIKMMNKKARERGLLKDEVPHL